MDLNGEQTSDKIAPLREALILLHSTVYDIGVTLRARQGEAAAALRFCATGAGGDYMRNQFTAAELSERAELILGEVAGRLAAYIGDLEDAEAKVREANEYYYMQLTEE